MKPQTIKINIENPCHENWDEMLQEEKGKFCLACQKTVVDFSKMSNEEIINFLNNTNDKVCGRIAKSQLNTPISNHRYNKTPFFNKYVAGFIMALGFYTPAHSQESKDPLEAHQTLGEIAVKQSVPSDKKLIINGRVIDSKTKKPIANAWVTVNGADITTSTDKNGNYSVSIPARFQNDALTLTITYSGYTMFEVTGIDYHKTNVNLVSKLVKEEEHIKGDIMIMGKIAPSKE